MPPSVKAYRFESIFSKASINHLKVFIGKTPFKTTHLFQSVFCKHAREISFKFVANSQQSSTWQTDFRCRFGILGGSGFQWAKFWDDWTLDGISWEWDNLCGSGCVCVGCPIVSNWNLTFESSFGHELHIANCLYKELNRWERTLVHEQKKVQLNYIDQKLKSDDAQYFRPYFPAVEFFHFHAFCTKFVVIQHIKESETSRWNIWAAHIYRDQKVKSDDAEYFRQNFHALEFFHFHAFWH